MATKRKMYKGHAAAVEAVMSGTARGYNVGSAADRRKAARDSLPEELRATYDMLVLDYQDFANQNCGHHFVSFDVCRDLVLAGWRKVIS